MVECSFVSLYAGCLHNDFITADRALLPFNSISAFNDSLTLDDNPLKFIVNNSVARELWCSNYTGSNYVEMNFEEPVIIEGVISRGAFLQSRRFYIANFSLLFSSNDVDDLETYSEVRTRMLDSIMQVDRAPRIKST